MQLLPLHGWLEVGVLGLQLFDPNLHLLLVVAGKQKLPEGSRERGREGRREGERGREREGGRKGERGREGGVKRGREGGKGRQGSIHWGGGGAGGKLPPQTPKLPPPKLGL